MLLLVLMGVKIPETSVSLSLTRFAYVRKVASVKCPADGVLRP